MKINRSVLTFILFLTLVISNCVIQTEPLEQSISFSLLSDSVSPFSPVKLCFSSPIDDSISPQILFFPQFQQYYITFNSSKDTLTINPTSPFSGNTPYKIHAKNQKPSPESNIPSLNDSAVFFTYPLEKEPNNATSIADSINLMIYGSISSVNDTDCFRLTNYKNSSKLIFKSIGSRSFFNFQDHNGKIFNIDFYDDSMEVRIPDSIVKPLYLLVYSFRKSCGGYYQIQIQ